MILVKILKDFGQNLKGFCSKYLGQNLTVFFAQNFKTEFTSNLKAFWSKSFGQKVFRVVQKPVLALL